MGLSFNSNLGNHGLLTEAMSLNVGTSNLGAGGLRTGAVNNQPAQPKAITADSTQTTTDTTAYTVDTTQTQIPQ